MSVVFLPLLPNNIQLFIQGAPNPPVAITGVPVVKSISQKKEQRSTQDPNKKPNYKIPET